MDDLFGLGLDKMVTFFFPLLGACLGIDCCFSSCCCIACWSCCSTLVISCEPNYSSCSWVKMLSRLAKSPIVFELLTKVRGRKVFHKRRQCFSKTEVGISVN